MANTVCEQAFEPSEDWLRRHLRPSPTICSTEVWAILALYYSTLQWHHLLCSPFRAALHLLQQPSSKAATRNNYFLNLLNREKLHWKYPWLLLSKTGARKKTGCFTFQPLWAQNKKIPNRQPPRDPTALESSNKLFHLQKPSVKQDAPILCQ